jgi:hypothetical protein
MTTTETVADVLAHIRSSPEPSINEKNEWADRIEAAMSQGEPVAWSRTRDICNGDGIPIGTDEPEIHWGSEHPDPSEAWCPLYVGPTPAPPVSVPVESFGLDAVPSTDCVHHDFSILDLYTRSLRWSHDTPNEVRDAAVANLRGLYTHLLTRGLFAGSGSWDAGRLAAAKWVEKRRCAFADEHGLIGPTTGVLEFGNGYPERDEYYCELSEIEEAIRALPAPKFLAHTVPDELTCVYMLGKIDGRRERHPLDKPTAPPAPVAPDWSPSDDQFRKWCETHDMPEHVSREAFDDAASLYLLSTPSPATKKDDGNE